MKCKLFALFAILSLGVYSNAYGCGHKPKSAGVDKVFEQLAQQAIIVHHNGFEDLIINVKYRFRGPGQNPDNLAWLIPTPHTPISYKVADPAIFKEALKIFPHTNTTYRTRILRKARKPKKAPRQIKLLDLVQVGNYKIQPIVTTGPQAATELNEWLSKNGYGTVPIKNMSWYLKKKWTFLAIKMIHKGQTKGMPDIGEFKPLHLRFKSKKIIYPLKFSSHQGVFNVSLFVITSKILNREVGAGYHKWDSDRFNSPDGKLYREIYRRGAGAFWQAAKYGFEIASTCRRVHFKGSGSGQFSHRNYPHLYRLLSVIDARDALPNDLFFNKFNGRNVNGEDNKVANWDEDFAIDYIGDEKSLNKVFSVEDRFRYLIKHFTYFSNETTKHHKQSTRLYLETLPISQDERNLLLWMWNAQGARVGRTKKDKRSTFGRNSVFQWNEWIHDLVERGFKTKIALNVIVKAILVSIEDAEERRDETIGAPKMALALLKSERADNRLFGVSELSRQLSKNKALKTHPRVLECLKRASQDKDERIRKLAEKMGN